MTPLAAPQRTCVGCRRVRAKAELVRLVRRSDGTVVRDACGRGRGAYVCPDLDCVARAAKPGRLSQAFGRPSVAGPGLGR
jgi:predicted RNA-binding protein YlxR (DUF448 family)